MPNKRTCLLAWLFLVTCLTTSLAQKKSKKDYLVTISTEFGDMFVILSDKAPKHKANFLKLANEGFYNDLLFHRVIDGFMIQGGDPKSKEAKSSTVLGDGDPGYTIPAEFTPALIHKKGALAAARNNNPEKASSGCQFYIVEGKQLTDAQLKQVEARNGLKYTDEQKKVLKALGGTPHLDMNYTVFGEVIKGLEIVEKIAAQNRDERDRPKKDIKMKVVAKKMRKKKITKQYGYQFE